MAGIARALAGLPVTSLCRDWQCRGPKRTAGARREEQVAFYILLATGSAPHSSLRATYSSQSESYILLAELKSTYSSQSATYSSLRGFYILLAEWSATYSSQSATYSSLREFYILLAELKSTYSSQSGVPHTPPQADLASARSMWVGAHLEKKKIKKKK